MVAVAFLLWNCSAIQDPKINYRVRKYTTFSLLYFTDLLMLEFLLLFGSIYLMYFAA